MNIAIGSVPTARTLDDFCSHQAVILSKKKRQFVLTFYEFVFDLSKLAMVSLTKRPSCPCFGGFRLDLVSKATKDKDFLRVRPAPLNPKTVGVVHGLKFSKAWV